MDLGGSESACLFGIVLLHCTGTAKSVASSEAELR